MAPLIATSSTDNAHLKWGVDERTGFVPSQAPLARLPPAWEAWETRLDSAVRMKLQLAEQVEMIPEKERLEEESKSRSWRRDVAKMPLLPIEELQDSERLLRRAHHVLTYMLQFYDQTVPPTEQIMIPRSLAVPLLQVSKYLQVPPIITYFDITIFNWRSIQPLPDGSLLGAHCLQALTTFTSTSDEEEFHLLSTRIQLRGAEALELLRLATERAFGSDDSAVDQAAQYLERAAAVIQDLREIMLSVKGRIDPEIFYNEI
ncbi:Indoleamine 2,3-dioxygenase [Leucoagaricus sp. SymC.cos]|nr:Indoleamine 2,3-dioxygenase [Leucoagaricus sp. SymC.cos]